MPTGSKQKRKKPVASQKLRRAYRSVTTKTERQAARKAVGKGAYAKMVKRAGTQLRKARRARGANLDTGGKTTKRATGISMGKLKNTTTSYATPRAAAKALKRQAAGKTGPTKKTKTVARIAKNKGISRKKANAIRKARK